jgi:hypothetical protein
VEPAHPEGGAGDAFLLRAGPELTLPFIKSVLKVKPLPQMRVYGGKRIFSETKAITMQPKEQNSSDTSQSNGSFQVTDKQISLILEDTQTTLSKSPEKYGAQWGLSMIDKWETILESSGKAGLAKIIFELKKLREILSAGQPDAHEVAASLATLGDETKKVADNTVSEFKAPLMAFGNLLVKAASSLSK